MPHPGAQAYTFDLPDLFRLNGTQMPPAHAHVWRRYPGYTEAEARCMCAWDREQQPISFVSSRAVLYCGAGITRVMRQVWSRSVRSGPFRAKRGTTITQDMRLHYVELVKQFSVKIEIFIYVDRWNGVLELLERPIKFTEDKSQWAVIAAKVS